MAEVLADLKIRNPYGELVSRCPDGCKGPWSKVYDEGLAAAKSFLGGFKGEFSAKDTLAVLTFDGRIRKEDAQLYLDKLM